MRDILSRRHLYQLRHDPGVFGGEHPASEDAPLDVLRALHEDLGVGTVLTPTWEAFTLRWPGVAFEWAPMDGSPTLDTLRYAVDIVRRARAGKRVVFVHCQMGVDRTGAVLASYARSLGVPADEAVASIAACLPESVRERAVVGIAAAVRAWEGLERDPR